MNDAPLNTVIKVKVASTIKSSWDNDAWWSTQAGYNNAIILFFNVLGSLSHGSSKRRATTAIAMIFVHRAIQTGATMKIIIFQIFFYCVAPPPPLLPCFPLIRPEPKIVIEIHKWGCASASDSSLTGKDVELHAREDFVSGIGNGGKCELSNWIHPLSFLLKISQHHYWLHCSVTLYKSADKVVKNENEMKYRS